MEKPEIQILQEKLERAEALVEVLTDSNFADGCCGCIMNGRGFCEIDNVDMNHDHCVETLHKYLLVVRELFTKERVFSNEEYATLLLIKDKGVGVTVDEDGQPIFQGATDEVIQELSRLMLVVFKDENPAVMYMFGADPTDPRIMKLTLHLTELGESILRLLELRPERLKEKGGDVS